MPGEETALEEVRPKWPPKPGTDISLEEEFGKLAINEPKSGPKIQLQSQVNQSAKLLENLILDSNEDKKPRERGLDDVDGHLDQVPAGASKGWSTDGLKGQRPPPPYSAFHVTKPAKNEANRRTQQHGHGPFLDLLQEEQRSFLLRQGTQVSHNNTQNSTTGHVSYDPIPDYYTEFNPPNLNFEEILNVAIALSESEQSSSSNLNFPANSLQGGVFPTASTDTFPRSSRAQSTIAPSSNQIQYLGSQAFPGINEFQPELQTRPNVSFRPPTQTVNPGNKLAQQLPLNSKRLPACEQVLNGFGGVPPVRNRPCASPPNLYDGQSEGFYIAQSSWKDQLWCPPDINTTSHQSQTLPSNDLTEDCPVSMSFPPKFPFPEDSSQIFAALKPQTSSYGKRSHVEDSNFQEPQNKSPKSNSGSAPTGHHGFEEINFPNIIPSQVDALEEIYRQVEARPSLLKDSICAKGDNSPNKNNGHSQPNIFLATNFKDGSASNEDNYVMLDKNPSQSIPNVALPAVSVETYLDSPPCSPNIDSEETIARHLVFLEPAEMKEFCKRHGEVVQEFINSQNQYMQTALYMAVKRQNYEAVGMCLQYRADPTIQGKDEKSDVMEAPLHVAIGNADPKMVYLLLQFKGIDIEEQRVYDRKTPLMLALHCHNRTKEEVGEARLVIIRMLVESNANLHKLDEQSDKTVFMMAIETGDLVLVKYILDFVTVQGSRELINRPNRAGNTSFHIAAGLKKLNNEDQLELLKVLVYYGGNTDALNLDNKTPKDWKKSLFDKMMKSAPYQPEEED